MPARVTQQIIRDARLLDANPRHGHQILTPSGFTLCACVFQHTLPSSQLRRARSIATLWPWRKMCAGTCCRHRCNHQKRKFYWLPFPSTNW